MNIIPAHLQAATAAFAKTATPANKHQRGDVLGTFEQSILLATLVCGPEATAKSIQQHLEEDIGARQLTAVFKTVERLEFKGLIEACAEEASPRKGGRTRKFYKVTEKGQAKVIQSISITANLALKAGLIKVA